MRVMSAGDGYRYLPAVQTRIAARVDQLDAGLAPSERAAAAERIEAGERERGTRRVVAGYDYTFSAPKWVPALWAVADERTRARIAQAHHALNRLVGHRWRRRGVVGRVVGPNLTFDERSGPRLLRRAGAVCRDA